VAASFRLRLVLFMASPFITRKPDTIKSILLINEEKPIFSDGLRIMASDSLYSE
jgi:hypothetical protein